jgi:hypothetical protein
MTEDFDETKMFQETPEQAASRIIKDAAPFAATAISELISDVGVSPSVRLRAAQYVIDRNLGPVGAGQGADLLESFFQEIQAEANKGR